MCGGIVYKLAKIPQNQLENFFTQDQIEIFKQNGELQSLFWSAKPVLPVLIDNEVQLIEWGNRDKQTKLPLTGWAKKESLDQGKWFYLHPKVVKILADKGYEKGIWFELDKSGFEGIIVESGDKKRVYMVTKAASVEYQKLTKHPREPIQTD